MDVHRAARIAAAAHGGQVVISQTTRDLIDGDSDLRDLGVHRLKDLTAPERLYQLGRTDFPPLRTLDATTFRSRRALFWAGTRSSGNSSRCSPKGRSS